MGHGVERGGDQSVGGGAGLGVRVRLIDRSHVRVDSPTRAGAFSTSGHGEDQGIFCGAAACNVSACLDLVAPFSTEAPLIFEKSQPVHALDEHYRMMRTCT